MKITVLTLFPEMFVGPFDHSILKRAQEKKLLTISIENIRRFGIGKHKIVDDTPYGGGSGMVMRVDVLDKAITAARCKKNACREIVILLDPQGQTLSQRHVKTLSSYDHLILVCGHYEGVDERVKNLVDGEISIGDYVLTGGEIPSMVLVDAISRLIPSVLGKEDASIIESFENNLLEFPQYTKPQMYKRVAVPPILLSGDHGNIAKWRKEQALKKTQKRRPDLLKR